METKLCKKIVYRNFKQDKEGIPTILVGIIEEEDNYFINFRTEHKHYRISKSMIMYIEDTEIEFRGGGDE